MSEETSTDKPQSSEPGSAAPSSATPGPAASGTATRKDGSGVFKSQDIAPQKMSKFANSAVSSKAVERGDQPAPVDGRYIGPEQKAADGGVYVESTGGGRPRDRRPGGCSG